MKHTLCLRLLSLLILPAVGAVAAQPAGKPEPVISPCEKPFTFGFGAWEKANTAFGVKADGIQISAKSCQGGAGIAGLKVNVTGYGDWSPAMTVAVTERNKAGSLNLHLTDANGTIHTYRFELRNLKPNTPQQLVTDYGASLAEPLTVEKSGITPGLGQISTLMIIGDWSDKPVDVVLSRIALVPPTDEMRAQRAQLKRIKVQEAERARLEAEAKARARKMLLNTGAPHHADGPEVRHVCAVAPDVIAITLQAGQHVSNQLIPYVAERGDEVVEQEKDKPIHEVRDGKVVDYFQKGLFRTVNGQHTKLGLLSPDGKWVFIQHESKGQLLDETVVDVPEAYSLTSNDDLNYARPRFPAKVFRKGKPNGFSRPLPFLYTISLKLPSPLKEGATYTIRFVGVNTSKATVAYVHKPRQTQSIALHAIQTGYRPDDPFKRAYLSFWMGVDQDGENGSCTPEVNAFELVDAAGKTVFTGRTELAKNAGEEEQICIHEKLDYTKAAVRRLDFSAFNTPGEYRVFIHGIGLSGPFRIAADVWEKPFKAAMQGILAQRQGIDLGPPACAYTRKRPFHPDDGVEFYQLTIPVQGGQEAGEGGLDGRGGNLLELSKAGKLQRVTGIWGGYQDAGDWDSLGGHLSATYDLLGLYDLNPAEFSGIKLALPAEAMKSGLPSILDEAMWQMPLWRRLQLPDGGVRGGYGYGWGCPAGTTSSMIKSAGVYAVDHETTLRYAAAAARAARVLAAFDKKLAAEYLESAKRAWAWVESHSKQDDAIYQKVLYFDKELPKNLRDLRAMAAVELLAATRDPAFDEAFKQSSELAKKGGLRYLDQLDADFAYARLQEGVGDPALKMHAIDLIATYADHAIEFSRKNAYDIIAGTRTDFPLIFACRYFSTPAQGGFALIYAYELTKKQAYLAAAVQGSNYCLGANPDNLSYCTGVGYNAQHFNFIVDAQVTGQLPDIIVGHIPYGQGNEGNSMSRPMNSWVQQWLLNFGPTKKMVPNWYDWPVNEQYIDFAIYPLHNENCFNATTVPAACYWFYLHTRPAAEN
ncbi:MAG: glycoside hydrolase family 9 protein [Thermoguttaceae bacterium]|jgi:endoglucanase